MSFGGKLWAKHTHSHKMLRFWDTVSREYTPFPTHKHPELTVVTLTPSVNVKCLSYTYTHKTHAKDMNAETPPAYYCASKNNHSLRITGRELKGGIRNCEHNCKETREVQQSGSTWKKMFIEMKCEVQFTMQLAKQFLCLCWFHIFLKILIKMFYENIKSVTK